MGLGGKKREYGGSGRGSVMSLVGVGRVGLGSSERKRAGVGNLEATGGFLRVLCGRGHLIVPPKASAPPGRVCDWGQAGRESRKRSLIRA